MAWFAMSCFGKYSIGNNSFLAEVLGVVIVMSFLQQGWGFIYH
jgi:hypothetical protein